jgi:uncharacterized integral membrane protein (TIGR00698 family)
VKTDNSPPPSTPPTGGRYGVEPVVSKRVDVFKLIREALPGLLLTLAISAAAMRLADVEYVKKTLHFGALLLVIVLGILWRNILPPPEWAMPGIRVAQKPILRWGVALLGFKLSIGALLQIGAPAVLVVIIGTTAALAFGIWFGKAMGLHEKLTILMAVGGAICGASAIVAAESVVKAEKEDVVAPIGVITLFGTLGILIYPMIGRALGMAKFLYAVWCGASLHETAQVVAAADALGVGAIATVVKLARIAMLAPVVFYLAWYMRKKGEDSEAKVAIVPWFLVLFVIFALINSATAFGLSHPLLPTAVTDSINNVWTTWILCIGMAGVGLQTGFRDLKKAGAMPLLVGFAQWLLLSMIAFGLASVLCKTAPNIKTGSDQAPPLQETRIKRPLT